MPTTYAIKNRKSGKIVCSGLSYEQAQAELKKFAEISPDAKRLYEIVPQSN